MNSDTSSYVLITPARNEAAFIEETIRSVIAQTILPAKWVIVNDGSTDNTAAIVRPYLERHPWIDLVNLPVRETRDFAAKVNAFNLGRARAANVEYSIIGNLDADVSLDPDHFEFLLSRFSQNPRLGVAGTTFREEGYNSETDSFEGSAHVSGQCQIFRRECFEEIGGYRPNRAGGIDWMAVTSARMMGWTTQSFREKSFFHHRAMGTAERGRLASAFSYGKKDYYLGGHPLWEAFRVTYRAVKRPYVLGGGALAAGYLWACVSREERPVSRELMKFHRREQMQKLKSILRSVLSFRTLNSFEVNTSR